MTSLTMTQLRSYSRWSISSVRYNLVTFWWWRHWRWRSFVPTADRVYLVSELLFHRKLEHGISKPWREIFLIEAPEGDVVVSRGDVLSVSPTGTADLAERQGSWFSPYPLVTVTYLSDELNHSIWDTQVGLYAETLYHFTSLCISLTSWDPIDFTYHSLRIWPPLWSSGQSTWLQIQRSRVWFPTLPDFLRSSGSGTGFTQPREDNWGATWMEK
jgi:hypothetical protein